MEMSKDRRWAVPLAWLAELDNCPFPGALPDAFGDRYLCGHNPVFARVRRCAIEFDYRISAADTPLWRDYQAFGMTTLQKILSGGIIPYHDTANTVRRLLERNPKVALPPAFILSFLKPNYAFHESAHCVAASILRRMESDLRAIAPHQRERFVLEATLAESFANTVETLGSLVRTMPLSDTLFYSLNSYMAPAQKRTVQLVEAAAKTGEYLRFALLFLASFEANLAAAPSENATLDRIALAAGCESGQAEAVRMITSEAFRLSADFRENTTPIYFDLLGCGPEYQALTQAGWLSGPDNGRFVRDLTAMLFDAAVGSSAASGKTAGPGSSRLSNRHSA